MSKAIYFKGLPGIRFIASFAVLLSHIELYKHRLGYESLYHLNVYQHLGNQGVKVFFVLSGFLITYLLLVEKAQYKKIDIAKFYFRRVLRIWPLYFLILLLSFFIFHPIYDQSFFPESLTNSFWLKLGLCFFILPNVVRYVFGPMMGINVLWSIGAEEQFYLIWPHLINKFSKKIGRILIIILSLIISIKGFIYFMSNFDFVPFLVIKQAKLVSILLDFDCMVIGGIFAYLYFNNSYYLKYIYAKATQIIVVILLLFLLIAKPEFYFLSNTIYSIIYGVIIINAAVNSDAIFVLHNKLSKFLGDISYGVYMYHTLIMVVVFDLIKFNSYSSFNFNVMVYSLSIFLTVGIATISYYLFEKPILNYKKKYMIIKSGN